MIRNFKTLGGVVIAVLVLGAVAASAVQASKFTASSYPTTVTATNPLGNSVMQTEAGSVECAEHWEGTLSEATETIQMTPTFTSCKAFGFISSLIDANGCVLRVHSNGKLDIVCSSKPLEVTAGTCVMHVGSQSGLSWIDLTNEGNHVWIGLNVSALTYNVTKDGFLCPFNGTGHKTGMNWFFNYPELTTKPVSGGTSFTLSP